MLREAVFAAKPIATKAHAKKASRAMFEENRQFVS